MKFTNNLISLLLFTVITIQMVQTNGVKKRVVIIGEMADMHDFLNHANGSERFHDHERINIYDNFDDFTRRGLRKRGYYHPNRRAHSSNSVFVPVAAYSVTHRQVPNYYDHRSLARFKHFSDRNMLYKTSSSVPSRTTQSAVYGYLNRPDLFDFGPRYYYNTNDLDTSASMQSSYTDMPSPSLPSLSSTIKQKTGGIGPGSLLLATLPLVLAPMLSYLFTPMIIPITATVAAGKRKKRETDQEEWKPLDPFNITSQPLARHDNDDNYNNYHNNQSLKSNQSYRSKGWKMIDENDSKIKEIQVIAKYLQKVHFDESDRDRSIVKYLQCNGLLSNGNHCLERLACEFTDPSNYEASALDRSVTSILLDHILNNKYVSKMFKKGLRSAAMYGRHHKGECYKFRCI